jgi:CRP/FNR family transcriptional regulator, cyclic AMP receptor protein
MRELPFQPGLSAYGLSACRLLQGLPAQAVTALETSCRWAAYEAGEVVLDADSKLRDVYFIAEGSVRIFHRLDGRREITFAEFHAGDAFGELSAIDGGGRTADAVASSAAIIAACPQETYLQALADHPALALAVMRRLTAIIRQSDKRIADLAAMSGAQRVYAELLRLAAPDPANPQGCVIDPAPLHRDLAGWAGVEADVVTRAIAHLMKTGLLTRRGTALTVADRARVDALARTYGDDRQT